VLLGIALLAHEGGPLRSEVPPLFGELLGNRCGGPAGGDRGICTVRDLCTSGRQSFPLMLELGQGVADAILFALGLAESVPGGGERGDGAEEVLPLRFGRALGGEERLAGLGVRALGLRDTLPDLFERRVDVKVAESCLVRSSETVRLSMRSEERSIKVSRRSREVRSSATTVRSASTSVRPVSSAVRASESSASVLPSAALVAATSFSA
jgi:hypothetical protein